jgi:hypothetical protein
MSDSKEIVQDAEKDFLQDVANISGKPGLFRILKPGRSGVIIESLDSKREKSMAAASSKVSILKDVSVYVEDDEQESIPLGDVFLKIRDVLGAELNFDTKKASEEELRDSFEQVLPNYHKMRVYTSDIKKIFSWYLILSEQLPEFFEKPVAEEVVEEKAPKKKSTSKKSS